MLSIYELFFNEVDHKLILYGLIIVFNLKDFFAAISNLGHKYD